MQASGKVKKGGMLLLRIKDPESTRYVVIRVES